MEVTDLKQKENKEPKGWVCPRCGKVNAPWKSNCDCVRSSSNFPFWYPPVYFPPRYVPMQIYYYG